jgi:hypothetical protein
MESLLSVRLRGEAHSQEASVLTEMAMFTARYVTPSTAFMTPPILD